MSIEPYRIFFFIGTLSSIMGISVWIFFFSGLTETYPLLTHSNLMFFAFLLSFVAGFLLTAVPKMSQTKAATSHEMFCYSILAFLQLIFSFVTKPGWSYLIATLQFTFLIRFIFIRFFSRKQNPPSGFIYVPVGLVMGFTGSLFSFLYYFCLPDNGFLITFSKLFIYQGFILNLIAGLGGRLIPTLSRTVGALSPMEPGRLNKAKNFIPMLILNFSLVAEGFGSIKIGNGLRFFVLLYIAINHFKIFAPKNPKNHLGLFLTVSSLFIVVPYLFISIFPAYKIHLLHLVYIGGFSLMTYLISVRVILAHGGHNLNYELKSHSLWIIPLFLIIASLFRLSVGFAGSSTFYSHAIIAASAFWIMGVLVWFFCIGRRVIKLQRGTNGSGSK